MGEVSEITRHLRGLIDDIGRLVDRLESSPSAAEHLEARARIGRLRAELDAANNQLSARLGMSSAKERILRYLLAHVGEVVDKEELAGVAGIFEFPRRIRELRSDEGWQISSMESHAHLRPGQYVLLSRERDLAVTSGWDAAHRIRRQGGDPVEGLVRLLREIRPRSLDRSVAQHAIGLHDLEEVVELAQRRGCTIECDATALWLST